MQHTYTCPSSYGHQYSLKICCTSYSVCNTSILAIAMINFQVYEQYRLFLCLYSNTRINARGAYNASRVACLNCLTSYKHKMVKYWLKTNTPYLEVSTSVRLVFSNHCGPSRINYWPSFNCKSTLNASSPLFPTNPLSIYSLLC